MGEGERLVFADLGQFSRSLRQGLRRGLRGPGFAGVEARPRTRRTWAELAARVSNLCERRLSRRRADWGRAGAEGRGRVVAGPRDVGGGMDGARQERSYSGGSLSLIGLSTGKADPGADLASQRGPCKGLERETGLARAELSASRGIGPFHPIPAPARAWRPLPSAAWEGSEVLSEFRVSSRFIEVGFLKRASDDFSHFLRFQRLPAVRLPN